ncbi:NYN domain-containing protein [Microbacterium sp. ZXX196]|uniref:NYN domain-containing protein n=1 Tax=Microbacterium sp. ZXX196 TaxID=2609291 RepID=UPI0012B79BF7|nr:NYN domain-containing protein [Microbacterium sp. ZXX196]MTE22802.1 NYN domain-containing protein [Microbacterium sp. ZXX196]
MTSPQDDGRVAVYLDFDNIVMSWYDRVHGRNSYNRDRARIAEDPTEPEIAERLAAATVDVGAILDYAASYGTLVLTRAYADWSSPVNAIYRRQLVGRAVDLVQLFPAAAYAKNGADIRLAVDTVEDMFRLADLTHVIVVAGDSDYVPLAQRCKRLGRYVIGVGVAGSTAKSLAAACDAFEPYDTLPGVPPIEKPAKVEKKRDQPADDASPAPEKSDQKPTRRRRSARPAEEPASNDAVPAFGDTPPEDLHAVATRLLERALRVGQDKGDAQGFLYASAVKQHIRRMDPSFSEKALGYRSFNDFLTSRDQLAEVREDGHERLVRLKA